MGILHQAVKLAIQTVTIAALEKKSVNVISNNFFLSLKE